MAKFIHVRSKSGKTDQYINVETVRYVQGSSTSANQCTVYFDSEHSLTIEISAVEVAISS